jgi:hypothetical protein
MLTAQPPTLRLVAAPTPPPPTVALEASTAAGWIAHLYPGWQISRVKGGWIAARLRPVTASQRRAGVLPSVGRATLRELARVLALMGEKLDAGY